MTSALRIPDVSKEKLQSIVHDIYTKPLQNVLLIDDEFVTFSSLLAAKSFEAERETLGSSEPSEDEFELSENDVAEDQFLTDTRNNTNVSQAEDLVSTDLNLSLHKIFDSCVNAGLIPYVENNACPDPKMLSSADLILLDYRLDPTETPTYCTNILKQLNNSPKLSLVVIYTKDTPRDVAREITINLRNGGRKNSIPTPIPSNISTAKLDELLVPYLTYADKELSELKKSFFQDIQLSQLKNYLEQRTRDLRIDRNDEKVDDSINCGIEHSEHPWIRGKNIFIIVVQKNSSTTNIHYFIDHLEAALCDHGPSPITMVTQGCLNALRDRSPEIAEGMFGDKLSKAAMLFHALSSESPTLGGMDRQYALRSHALVHKIMEFIASSIHQDVNDLAREIFNTIQYNNVSELRTISLKKEGAAINYKEKDLYFALNTFLCGHRPIIDYITTGTIFKTLSNDDSTKLTYWACVSPACDLVPERTRGVSCYQQELFPGNIMIATKLINSGGGDSALAEAATGRHVFISEAGSAKKVALSITSKEGVYYPHTFYSKNGFYLEDNKTALFKVIRGSRGALKFIEIKAEAVAQLRPEYSARLLQHVGLHNSRIGVDFVSMLQATK